MQVDIDLEQYITWKTGVRTEQNKISDTASATPAIFFQRRPSNQDLLLSGGQGLADINFDLEIYGTDIDAVELLADHLRGYLHGFSGQMGRTTVLGMFVSDSEEDYQSKVLLNTDQGLHVSSFSLQLLF